MITLKNVILRRSAKVLLDRVNATINPGEHVGLVGRNGAGKSSLFALFNGGLHEDGGDFFIPPQWRMSQVAQNMPETDEPATDFVVAGDTRLMEVQARLAQAEADDDGMALAHAYTDLHDAGSHDAVPRAQALILGLGFKVSELDKPVNSFSGGWRMRLQLARALMCPSDLLLLDEPTNHLDLDALVWLEAWLKRYEGTMIVISHDREFLDAVTDVTMHIDHAQLTRYGGNYSKFEDLRAQQLELQQASFSKQQDKIAHLQKFIARFKAKASKAKQAQSRVKALERMEKIAPVLADAEFTFEFKEPTNLPNPMLAITDASFGYLGEDGVETTILNNVSRSVLAGQRIGILGANGQGKSTLVKTIAKALAPLGGTTTEGKGLVIGYFAQQELDVLSMDDGPLMHMVRLARDVGPAAREQELRDFLGRFRFTGDMVQQAVGSLSGLATASSIETWYATLEKPSFNPPNWIFGPVWTLLYVLMGIAAGLVWNARHDQGQVRSALRLYIIQLVLNATWSLVFFSLRSPAGALVNIVLLLIAIVLCIRAFRVVQPRAAYLLYPYLAWVSFATVLNASVAVLN